MSASKATNVDIVDFHAHILPSADHGSSSIETSLAQLALARDAGVTRIVATPHFYPSRHTLDQFLERRNGAWERLRRELVGDMPDIRVGAEVLICNGIENLPGLERLFITGTNTLMLELPFADFQEEYIDSAERLVLRGINVVLAHADRYDEDHIDEMVKVGCKIQLNADAFDHLFMKSHIKNWLSSGSVIALGSDIHHKDKCAYRSFLHAIKKVNAYIGDIKKASDDIWNKSKIL